MPMKLDCAVPMLKAKAACTEAKVIQLTGVLIYTPKSKSLSTSMSVAAGRCFSYIRHIAGYTTWTSFELGSRLNGGRHSRSLSVKTWYGG